MATSDYDVIFDEYAKEGDPRFLFANFTSSLLIVNSTLLAFAALALLGLGALAYLLYFLTTQNSGGGGGYGYGSSSGYGYSEDEYGYSRRFRRDTKDTEWIRILTLLDVGTKMYNDMTPENMDKRCPAKIICQAFESREIIGGSQSYLSLFYQFINSMKFVSNMEIDDNYLTEETSSCKSRYPECPISLLTAFKTAFEERKDAKLKFVKK